MARSSINLNGMFTRPTWSYDVNQSRTDDQYSLALLESIRNVLEGIADSQMLQCSVAGDIRKIRITLQRIDRRLAKRIKP